MRIGLFSSSRALAVGRGILPVVFLAFLTGCHTYGSSEAIKSLPSDLTKTANISDIEIKALPPDVSPEFREKLNTALLTETKKCATGTHPLKLSVSIGRLTNANAAATILVGDSEDIKGSAQLIEPANGTVVGDYDINKSIGGGGVFAAIGMAGGEVKLANAFADEICAQAFAH
jgi:hypothetical protein